LGVTGPRGPLSQQHRVVPPGGWIGRSARCDVVLEDPDRFVSSRHARIDYSNGLFWLSDHSTNGTFLNGDVVPMAPKEPRPLRHGDRLKIGLFEIKVTGDAGTAPEGKAPGDPVATPLNTDPLADLARSWSHIRSTPEVELPRFDVLNEPSAGDHLTTLLADLIKPKATAAPPAEPAPAVGQPAPQALIADRLAPPPPPIIPVPQTGQAPDDLLPRLTDEMSTIALPAAASHGNVPAGPAPRNNDRATAALAAFWRGLGVLPTQIDPVELCDVMSELGLALREAVDGFGGLLRTVSPSRRAAENPLSDGHTGLRRHLQQHAEAKQTLDDAVRNVFTILAERDDAYVAAVNAGVRRALQSVSASSIEERFGHTVRSSFRNRRRAELWRLLRSMEAELIDLAEMQFRKEVSDRMSGRVRKMFTYEDGGKSF
jgi:type VI secretion system FHA domain protein